MDHDQIETLRERHPAWRLMRADNAPLVLSFLGLHFVEDNNGARPAGALADELDDLLTTLEAGGDPDRPRYPKRAEAYLADWSADGVGWLRRFYPVGSDEVHYDATPALEKAYGWVMSLPARPFVGTESRLTTAVDLLRQIAHGSESDPDVRLAELRRRRDAIDQEIERAEAGRIDVLDPTAIRERYQQFATTARELLADFRQVEDNFRALDRSAEERIAAWGGSKGELLGDLVGSRADIAGSDQGRSFQAFYDFLLSEARQDELATLLTRVAVSRVTRARSRLRTVHHDWSDAAERTQRTVRQVSEQLRRFLDDQVWLDNRRVLDLARSVEAAALACREAPPRGAWTSTCQDLPSPCRSSARSSTPARPPWSTACSTPTPITRSTSRHCSVRPTSTRAGWPVRSAPSYPSTSPRCSATSSGCSLSSKARLSSSPTSRWTTPTSR